MSGAGAPGPTSRMLLRLFARLLTALFATTVVASLVVLVVLPRATHGSAMTVLTGSMTPGIPVGSVVMVRPVDPATLRVGDVATYQVDPAKEVFVTHRITEIDTSKVPTRYTFKGDANRGADLDPVLPDQIRGEVWFHVPYLGSIRDGLHGRGGVTLWASLLLAGYALSQTAAGLRERKRKGQASPLEVPVSRSLLVATLPIDRLTSRLAMGPTRAAASWGGVLVHEDQDSCVIMLAPEPDEFANVLDSLHQVGPSQLLVVDEPGTLAGPPARELVRSETEDDRVAT